MIVLIPTNEDKIGDGICPSFGRAPYFMIYNTENETWEFAKNPGAESSGGAGIVAAQAVLDLKVELVLTPRLGKNSADLLTKGQIEIFKSVTDDIMENIDLLKEGKLDYLTDIHPGFHSHG